MSAVTVLLHGNDRLCGAIEQHLTTTGSAGSISKPIIPRD
jgi:hypothetical protein